MNEECCNEKESCCKEVTPEQMCKQLAQCLEMAQILKGKGGIGGREAALVVTHLEDAMFRAGRYRNEVGGVPAGMCGVNAAVASQCNV